MNYAGECWGWGEGASETQRLLLYSHNIVQFCNPECVGCFSQLAHKQIIVVPAGHQIHSYLHGDSIRPTGSRPDQPRKTFPTSGQLQRR